MRKKFIKKVLMTVFGLMCAGAITAQWNPQEGIRLTTDGISGYEAQTNSNGVTFVAYWRFVLENPNTLGSRYADNVDVAYYLQIIDKDGNKLLEDDHLISNEPTRSSLMGTAHTLFIDDDGNALYIVKDERNATYYQQGFFVYKISPTGQMLWEEPVDLGRGYAPGQTYDFSEVIQVSDDGDYLFAYDGDAGDEKMYIVVERASKEGELRWDAPLLLTDPAESYHSPYLVPDESLNRFKIVYSKGSLTSGRLYAQRFATDKSLMWTTPVTVYDRGFVPFQTPMTVVEVISDQKGGCFVAWYEDHLGTKYEKAFVSHILQSGQQGFVLSPDEQGIQLSWSEYMRAFRPTISYDPTGESLYAAFDEHNLTQSYRTAVLQKVSNQGELLWSDAEGEESPVRGKLLNVGELGYYSIQSAGADKVVAFYQHNYVVTGARDSTVNIAVLLDKSTAQEEKRLEFAGEECASRSDLTSSALQKEADDEYFFTFWKENGAVYAQKVPADLQLPVDETGLTSVAAGNSWKVSLANHTLNVLNPAREYIDRISLYAPDGSLLQEFSIRSADNVLIPTTITQKIVLVKITGKNTTTIIKTINDE
jgi:hypothetical protein